MAEATFTFTVDSDLTPDEAWRRVVDVSHHGDVVPLTRGSGPSPDDAEVGSRYVARTAVGPVGFDDVMVVRELAAGRHVVFEKVGRVIGGVVTVDVASRGVGSTVAWHQSVILPWLPASLRPLARVVAPVVGRGYRHVVTQLLHP